ncbi:MAG: DNA alkylation repair protein [Spirochaetaceae bacterium]|nr:DNA alkylation repair protein [Spirochaetaceae bacterium]
METPEVMRELAALGKDSLKKRYIGNGAQEPLFGVATGAMKPLAKKTGKNQLLAEELYATGNYDAMYFAGIIAEPDNMGESDFNRWMEGAYFFMLSDFVVAVTLAEAKIAKMVAAKWLDSSRNLTVSGGWCCWSWLAGWRPDGEFETEFMRKLLQRAREDIVSHDGRARIAIRDFIIAAGVSYKPLHNEALMIAEAVDSRALDYDDAKCFSGVAKEITVAAEKGRIGFKRKNVRC